jgi:heme exporter protein D
MNVISLTISFAMSVTGSLGPYATFILTSYALVAAVVLLLIGWVAIDYRRQTQQLSKLEAEGAVRRSGRSAIDLK